MGLDGILTIDNSNNGNICTTTGCPTNKGNINYKLLFLTISHYTFKNNL